MKFSLPEVTIILSVLRAQIASGLQSTESVDKKSGDEEVLVGVNKDGVHITLKTAWYAVSLELVGILVVLFFWSIFYYRMFPKARAMRRRQRHDIILGVLILFLFVCVYLFVCVLLLRYMEPEIIAPVAVSVSPVAILDRFNQNQWYGWQPKISSSMQCSWKECLIKDHSCTTCRDEPGPFLEKVTPPQDWIPDVTMLRRMFLEGHDAHGNPWPPPLDDELCEAMGPRYKNGYSDVMALDAIPVMASPISNVTENKLLCLVYTMKTAHSRNIRAIRETWASGCDGFLAFSTESDPRIPAISVLHRGPEEYNNMWQKVRSIWKFVGKHYIDEFDWFHLGGEDMFVLPQNLKNYLGRFNASGEHFLGRRFNNTWKEKPGEHFNTGGPGYTLSKSTLQCFLENIDKKVCEPNAKKAEEDVYISRCLRKACGIHVYDTRDDQQRERFHHFTPRFHYGWKHPKELYDDWYAVFNQEWGILTGKDCCAPDTVSFHQLKDPTMQRHLFHYLHGCKRQEKMTKILEIEEKLAKVDRELKQQLIQVNKQVSKELAADSTFISPWEPAPGVPVDLSFLNISLAVSNDLKQWKDNATISVKQIQTRPQPEIEQPLVFFHIRKAGGSTLRQAIFNRAKNKAKINPQKLWIPCFHPPTCLDYSKLDYSTPPKYQQLKVYGSHVTYEHMFNTLTNEKTTTRTVTKQLEDGSTVKFLKLDKNGKKIQKFDCLTTLRPTVDRVVSCWNFQFVDNDEKSKDWNFPPADKLSPKDWEELLPVTYDRYYNGCNNEITRIFSSFGDDQETTINGLSPNHPKFAVEFNNMASRLSKCVIVVSDRCEESNLVIVHYFPWLSGIDLCSSHVNKGKGEKKTLTQGSREVILKQNAMDELLYQFGTSIFEEQVNVAWNAASMDEKKKLRGRKPSERVEQAASEKKKKTLLELEQLYSGRF